MCRARRGCTRARRFRRRAGDAPRFRQRGALAWARARGTSSASPRAQFAPRGRAGRRGGQAQKGRRCLAVCAGRFEEIAP
eukprot:7198444-Pyramimonas_sp.AAC.1